MPSCYTGNLSHRSIEIIKENQGASGAYYACPTFRPYRYCWFRDGSYCAYAMDCAGEHESAARFHTWAAAVIRSRHTTIRSAIVKSQHNEPLGNSFLHTRYDLDGRESKEEWSNFQLDGFGTWLWSLGEHRRMSGSPLPHEWIDAARLTADYLIALWRYPCYDCWEEFPDTVHSSTLAALYGGLEAYERMTSVTIPAVREIGDFLAALCVEEKGFIKSLASTAVDASLLALSTPYRVVAPDDPLMIATVERIERELRRGGGVHRYNDDSYYGGGEWVLLSAWLGWYYTEIGKWKKAASLKQWVEEQADANGNLPEQVPATLNYPDFYPAWLKKWGTIARPLLWSHAKYIILSAALLE